MKRLTGDQKLRVHPGVKVGRLTVVSTTRLRNRKAWECLCACGNLITVRHDSLTSANTKSCGCLSVDSSAERMTTHGMSNSPEYNTWRAMKDRCLLPSEPHYPDYGGRGITICDRWMNSFENFLADMGQRPSPRHSLDRIENDGNYEPSNCRWATRIEQQNNRRANRLLTFKGETKTMADWSRALNLKPFVIRSRLRFGWSVEDALSVPVIPRMRGSRTKNGIEAKRG